MKCCSRVGRRRAIRKDLYTCPSSKMKLVRKTHTETNCELEGKFVKSATCLSPGYECVDANGNVFQPLIDFPEPEPLKPVRPVGKECCMSVGRRRAINSALFECPEGSKLTRQTHTETNCMENGKLVESATCLSPGWECTDKDGNTSPALPARPKPEPLKPVRPECCSMRGRRRAVHPDSVHCKEGQIKKRGTHTETNCMENGKLV